MWENAVHGYYSIGRAPCGFHKLPIKDSAKTRYILEPDPDDSISAEVVRRIFEMALKRIGCKQIVMTLNREGFLTSTGQRWGKTTVHKILNNEAYCGTLVFGGRPGHTAIHNSEPPVRVENAWPPIIDKDTFLQVKKATAKNAPKVVHPRVIPSFYLLSGILVCSCGSAMVARRAKSHQYYYHMCNRSCSKKAFLRSFVKKIVIEREKVKLYYNLPVPPGGRKTDTVGVLPVDTPSVTWGIRTPDPLRVKQP